MAKLYVGNLPYSYNDDQLSQLFADYGVTSAAIIVDRASGRSKGFGFVELDDAMAEQAITALNGTEIEGRNLTVSVARPMRERPSREY